MPMKRLFQRRRILSPGSMPLSFLSVGGEKLLTPGRAPTSSSPPAPSAAVSVTAIPNYLQQTYWWAYLHPAGVRLFERPWIVNSILWGNYDLLAGEAIRAIDPSRPTLQVACAYGDVTPRLARHMRAPLDVVDVAPIQLENLRRKLEGIGARASAGQAVTLSLADASRLSSFRDASREQVLFFFLLHEVPGDVRQKALAEAWRVLADGGRLVIVDYHQPSWWSFQRYIMPVVFRTLEPFAMDLWENEITTWLPQANGSETQKSLYCHGLYQRVVIEKKRSS